MFLPAETQAGSVMGWHAGIGSVTAGEVGCALAGRGGNFGGAAARFLRGGPTVGARAFAEWRERPGWNNES